MVHQGLKVTNCGQVVIRLRKTAVFGKTWWSSYPVIFLVFNRIIFTMLLLSHVFLICGVGQIQH